MGESDAARTERELTVLRGRIDGDVALLRERVRSDLDLKALVRRRPGPVIGGAVGLATLVAAAIARRLGASRQQRPMKEIDELIERLGGRVDRMKRKSRERLRESIRAEMGEADTGTRVERVFWTALTSALTALGVAIARGSAGRFFGERPGETPEERR